MAEQIVTLQPRESRVISFQATPTVVKTYQVSVDGLTGNFKAVAPPPITKRINPNGFGGIFGAGGILNVSPYGVPHWMAVSRDTIGGSPTFIWELRGLYCGDLFTLEDFFGSGTINWVRVYISWGAHPIYGGNAKTAIKTGGTIYDGVEDASSSLYTVNPRTGNSWIREELLDLQAGVSLRSNNINYATACYRVYVDVNFTPYS